jgi:2-oxoisovalerate dehydrogenase E1 component
VLRDPGDAIFSNHRNHGHFLTYSGNCLGLLAEIMGREDGVCKGLGGSQHILYRGFHSNGVQAGLTAVAVGNALRRKLAGETGITAAFIGDGTLGEGLLYESLNLASVWQVPVLFVVENNRIAQTTPAPSTIAGGTILLRGKAFGLSCWCFNDDDPDFFQRVEGVLETVRSLNAPGFLVINTDRLGPHSKGDDSRDSAEMASIRDRDPLKRLGDRLTLDEKHRIDEVNREFVATTREVAAASPPARYRHRPKHSFTRSGDFARFPNEPISTDTNVRASLNSALRHLLSNHSDVVLLGEDLHDPYGGAFKVTAGLSTEFPGRVISTPISEAAIVGAGIGLALSGWRPVVEVMFADFLSLAMDQILNHAVKFAAFPETRVPLVIRTPSGGGRGYGATHSQSPESLFAGVPGLTVVFPSHRHNPGLLLRRAALDWSYPCVFFEHKLLYGLQCGSGRYRECVADPDDVASYLFPTLERGPANADLTLVTYGGMLPEVERAVAALEEEELAIRIVVLSLLAPLPRRTLLNVVASGSERIVVVEEGHSEFGFAAELGSLLLENGYSGKFSRVGAPPIPIPAARTLESDVIPNEQSILEAVYSLFRP